MPPPWMREAFKATEEDRKAFDRVVEIAEVLVKRGVAYEESSSLAWVNDVVGAVWGPWGLVWLAWRSCTVLTSVIKSCFHSARDHLFPSYHTVP